MNYAAVQEFGVTTADGVPVRVSERSAFEARQWAANKVMPNFVNLCNLERRAVHLGPVCTCGRCYVHCQCPVTKAAQAKAAGA